jgi:hypothetical protein
MKLSGRVVVTGSMVLRTFGTSRSSGTDLAHAVRSAIENVVGGLRRNVMFKEKKLMILFVAYCFIALGAARSGENPGAKTDLALHIDIPTRLEKANGVVDFGHLVFGGEMPFALGDIHLLARDLRNWNAKGQLIVIFHGDAA